MKRLLILVFCLALVIPARADNFEGAIDIYEACPVNASESTEMPSKPYEAISLSLEEKSLLAAILWAEANNQPDSGKQACIEVVFNRMSSDSWPDDLTGVLSQKGQFATWKYRNKVTPTQSEYDAIEAVLNETETVLPSKSYVFFDTKGKNGRDHVKIKDHYFGRQK